MRVVTIDLPEPTILLNPWQRLHWRERKQHQKRLAWAVDQALGREYRWQPPIERCRVHVDRYSSELPDWDGLYGGLKPLLDCLVVQTNRNRLGLGVIRDDNPRCIEALTAQPWPAPRGQGRTIVTIQEVE